MNTYYKKYLTKIILAITVLSIVISPFCFVEPAQATVDPTNFNHVIPFTITDTSGVARTNVPVIITYDVNNRLVLKGYTNATATNTYVDSSGAGNNPIGSGTAYSYLMSTSNITVVIPSLPAYGVVTINLYTGYSPVQTAFPIILGSGGYFTVADSPTIEPSNNFTVSLNNAYIDTTAGNYKYLFTKANYNYIGGLLCEVDNYKNGVINARMGFVTYPIITSNATTADGADLTTHPITMPASLTAGNLLVLAFSASSSGGITISSGWTALAQDGNGLCWIYYKIANGSDTATVTTVAAQRVSAIVLQIANWSSISTTTQATGSSVNPDPPSYNTAIQKAYTWLALAGCAAGGTFTAYPAGYSGNTTASTIYGAIGFAFTTTNATTENPGAFTINPSTGWAASTIAISPVITTKVLSASVATGEHSISVSADSTNFNLIVDGSTVNTTTLGGVTTHDVSDPWVFMNATNNSMSYLTSANITIGGTNKVYFAPNSIISGTTLPDRESSGGSNDATITWGTNSNISVTGGDIMTSSSATVVGTSTAQFQGNLEYMGTFTTLYLSFEYGTTTAYGAITTETSVAVAQTHTVTLSGLSPNTTYHYRALARLGSVYAYGADISFTTLGSTASGGSTNPTINSVNLFRNYISPSAGDILLVADISCTYPPYYPSLDPTQYFQVQLIATDNSTILGATPLRQWGERPESLYFNSTFVTSNLTWGSFYYVRLYSSAANVTVSYTLVDSDWKGYDLSQLDEWCFSTAKRMEISDQVATGTYVQNTTGQGKQITDSAGSFFTVGIPSIGMIRPLLFTTSQTQALPYAGTDTNTWDKTDADPAGWRAYVGAVIAGDVDTMALPFGVSGKDFAAFLCMVAIIGCMLIVVSSTGGFGALGSILLAVPILWLGTWFRMLPVALLVFTVLFFGLMAIRQLIIKPL